MSDMSRTSLGTAINIYEVYSDPRVEDYDIDAGNVVVYVGGVSPIWFVKKSDGLNTDVAQIVVCNTWDAIVAPTANDDIGDGYSPGSKWFDTVLSELYMCVDAAVGAAVWIKLN